MSYFGLFHAKEGAEMNKNVARALAIALAVVMVLGIVAMIVPAIGG